MGMEQAIALPNATLLLRTGVFGESLSLTLPHPAQIALAILLLAALLWITEVIPLFVTSLLVLLLSLVWLLPTLRTSGIAADETVFLAPFFSDVILLFLGGFVLSAAMRKYRLDQRFAHRILAHIGTSAHFILLAILGITALLSMWLSNTATAAMMLGLCLPIVQSLPEGDRLRQAIVLSVAFGANVGGLGTPVGSPPNAIAIQYMRQGGFAPSFALWMLIGVPGVLVMLLVTWGLLLLLFRQDLHDLKFEPERVEISSRRGVWVVFPILLLTILGWVTEPVHGFSAGTVALLPVVVLFGSRILSVGDLRSLSWDVLLMMGGGLCLGKVVAISGLAAWFVDRLPIESTELFGLIVLFGSVGCLLSSVMSNTATANLLMPIILGLGIEHLSPVLVGVAFACTLAMPLPISTPPNALAFGSGELRALELFKLGSLVTITGLVLALTTGYWWWDLVGLF